MNRPGDHGNRFADVLLHPQIDPILKQADNRMRIKTHDQPLFLSA